MQSRLCWQWGIERGRQMLLEQLPYAISGFEYKPDMIPDLGKSPGDRAAPLKRMPLMIQVTANPADG